MKDLGNTFTKIETKRIKLLKRLSLADSTLFNKSDKGGWSVVQVLNHLISSEQGSLEYCKKKMQAKDLKEVTRLQILRMGLFNIFQTLPFRLKAPKFLSQPNNTEAFEEVCKKWDNSRAELLQFLTEIHPDYHSKSIYKHPFAGRVDLTRMLHFFAAHQLHHEYQIGRILKNIKK